MKKLILSFLIAISFLSQKSFALSTKNELNQIPYKDQTQIKLVEDIGYFYGYLSGSRCLYLFRISLGSRIDYSGRSVETYDVSLVNEFNSEGFQTMICPEEAGEWFV